jgi:2,7-dihydroxy-5-methyl-1-naphthoate 7-O-methyltransferase
MPRPETLDLETLTDLCTPWCLRVVATLGIARHIADGVTDVDALAAAAGCDAGALQAVLGHLATKGVFQEVAPGRFALTSGGERLVDPPPELDLTGIGGRMAEAWATLPAFVRTGEPAYHERFGLPFWEDLATHPEIAASFDALMGPAGHGVPDAAMPLTGGWDSVRTVVDVGGGTGVLLAELLRAHPVLHGTLVDLPGTVARAGHTFAAGGVADRVTTVGQSFFDPLPAGADVYLLSKVLNDWPDVETTALLARCADAALPAGRLLVVGGVAPDDAPRRLTIEMVLVGGRTDTLTEFVGRAADAGLEVTATGRDSSGRFVVECRPTWSGSPTISD